VTQVLHVLVTLNWNRAVLYAYVIKSFEETSVIMVCHFCSGIGSCKPSRLKYINFNLKIAFKIIRQVLQKNLNPTVIISVGSGVY
jgi:hypothetical protein